MKSSKAHQQTVSRSSRILRRTRVLQAIRHALRSGICWIAAPAGYGKTTATRDYLRQSGVAHWWYQVDEGDQDVAGFFHRLAKQSLGERAARRLPVFGPEYAEQPQAFAHRFFQAYFQKLRRVELLVMDDLHCGLEASQFRSMFAIMLLELPEHLRCVCVSRTLPPPEMRELMLKGRLTVLDQPILQCSDSEARALVAKRIRKGARGVDASAARGWAAGLVLLADSASAAGLRATPTATKDSSPDRATVFKVLARQLFDAFTAEEQDAMLKLSLLPEIAPELVKDVADAEAARSLLSRLHQRQLLVTRDATTPDVYQLHDLLREFLHDQLTQRFTQRELTALRERIAQRLHGADRPDEAIDLALQARAWPFARHLIGERAATLIAQGRRVTLIEWCGRLPPGDCDAWICYWLGVANMADDATAEAWFARAWTLFTTDGSLDGQCLTAARAVLSKSDSWRTHEGLAAWTQRLIELIGRDLPQLSSDDQLLAWAGMLRAVDFAQDFHSDAPAVHGLTRQLLARLAVRSPADTVNLRLMASHALIDHAGLTGNRQIFEQAVDGVADDLDASGLTPWVRGVWLVGFGSVTSRYFSYARRGFPYTSSEQALRAAVAIGEREGLRGVEFGALYHLQLLSKMRNDWSDFAELISRIAEIADSRFTTQAAVAADCEAALHTRNKKFLQARLACERFMTAIEVANEPPIERWPHFITQYQVLLADGRPDEAAAFLGGLITLFDGALRQRMQACIALANAFAAKWSESGDYPDRLQACLCELNAANWAAVLINLPEHLAELCADGLGSGIESDYCATLIKRRRLRPPSSKPASWPWPLRMFVMGGFRLERDGESVLVGNKLPTRSLDILRVLAVSKDNTCSLPDLYEWLWPDADGDQAKAACEQALHRLRKLLALPEMILLREGRLHLAPDLVWIDIEDWEHTLARAFRPALTAWEADCLLQECFDKFGGDLFRLDRAAPWMLPATERVRSKFIDLTERLARRREAAGNHSAARAVYLRTIDLYPASIRCYEGLIRNRLAERDEAGALEDYARYLRVAQASDIPPSPAIRALLGPLRL